MYLIYIIGCSKCEVFSTDYFVSLCVAVGSVLMDILLLREVPQAESLQSWVVRVGCSQLHQSIISISSNEVFMIIFADILLFDLQFLMVVVGMAML